MFLSLLLCICAPSHAVQDEARFAAGMEEVRELAGKERWARARTTLLELLEANREAAYVVARLPEIRDDLRRFDFWVSFEEPQPDDLTWGEVLRYSESTGRIRLRYQLGEMSDGFDGRRKQPPEDFVAGFDLAIHEILFEGSYTVILKGDDARDIGNVLVCLGEPGSADLTGYGVIFNLGGGTGGIIEYAQGRKRTTLATKEQRQLRVRKPYEIKVTVREREIVVGCNGKRFVTCRKNKDLWGRLGINGFSGAELSIEGKAATAWMRGRLDRAILEARTAFEESWKEEAALPAWLAAVAAGDEKEKIAEFPDPERVAHQIWWKRFATHLDKKEFEEAREMIQQLDEEATTDAFRTWATALTAYLYGRFDEARDGFERVIELRPEFTLALVMDASAMAALGDRKGAIGRLETVITDHSGNGVGWSILGTLYLLAGHTDEARDVIGRAQGAGIAAEELEKLSGMVLRTQRGPQLAHVYETETRHYRITSDISNRICVDAGKILEEALQLFQDDFRRLETEMERGRRFKVYLFSGEAGYLDYAEDLPFKAPEHSLGLYTPHLKQLLIWNLPDRELMLRTVRHEGFHQFLDVVLPGAPFWLNEGLGEYYETADPSRGFGRSGAPNAADLERLRIPQLPWVPYDELLRMGPGEFQGRLILVHYAQSWALVHYLMQGGDEQRALLDAYLDKLAAGEAYTDIADVLLGHGGSYMLDQRVKAHVRGLDPDEAR